VTVNATNEIRYKVAQNFKQMIALQLNDTSDYAVIVGRTGGLTPYRCKGRGLINQGKVYEFQTAYCKSAENQTDFLKNVCAEQAAGAKSFALRIPVLPDIVNLEYLKNEEISLEKIPLGVDKKTLKAECFDCSKRVIYPVASQELSQTVSFAEELLSVLSKVNAGITLVDPDKLLSEQAGEHCRCIRGNPEGFVRELFADMVARNNDYVDSGMNVAVLDRYEEKILVVMGVKRLLDQLTEDGRDKFAVLTENARAIYGIHMILLESAQEYSHYTYESWYKRHVSGTEGLWIGDGIADQAVLKLSKYTPELYEEIGCQYGYLIRGSRRMLIKLVSSGSEEEQDG
ncbi:MAG: hypothetical protein NC124_16010, partial [Clostridium sp.]|nr:hypothetical protein [Clostridium sp.]